MNTPVLVPPEAAALIAVDPERHSGTPCFVGTRVPVQDMFDFLRDGGTLPSFLASFPTVGHEQAVRVLRLAEDQEAFCPSLPLGRTAGPQDLSE